MITHISFQFKTFFINAKTYLEFLYHFHSQINRNVEQILFTYLIKSYIIFETSNYYLRINFQQYKYFHSLLFCSKIARFNTRALTLKSLSLLNSKHKPIHPSPVETENNIFMLCARIGGHPQRLLLQMLFETYKEILQ